MSDPQGFDAVIEALQIFKRYENPSLPFHCEHDTLYVCIDPENVSAEDKARLDTLGFFEGGEEPGFMSYRFGSC